MHRNVQIAIRKMTNLNKWGELYDIYKKTHRSRIVKSLYRHKPISKTWPYFLAFFMYLAVSVGAFFLGRDSNLSLFSVALAAIILYVWLELRIQNEYKNHYVTHNLKSHPFFLRTRYLRYILFAEELTKRKTFTPTSVEKLIEWEGVRKEKLETNGIFNAPILLIFFTSLASLTVEYLKQEKLVSSQLIYLVIFIVALIVWFLWTLSDLLQSHRKKCLEICRFLKWWRLDC